MADGEGPGGPQFHGTWLSDKAQPLPGTPRNPQGRLFRPTGRYTGDPFKLHPEQWLNQTKNPTFNEIPHSDIISWHSSESSQLPRYDDPESRRIEPQYDWHEEGEEGDYDAEAATYDVKERPLAQYGSAVGMHFGNIRAASERRQGFIHPARIPRSTLAEPPEGSFSTTLEQSGKRIAGPYRSKQKITSLETGEQKADTRWTDEAANYALKATDLVESGKALAYRNVAEAHGSTSYRTLPENTRTWSEDVLGAIHPESTSENIRKASRRTTDWPDTEHGIRNVPHPALVHLAEKGYNPVIDVGETPRVGSPHNYDLQMSLPFNAPENPKTAMTPQLVSDQNRVMSARMQHFDEGRFVQMKKPKREDAW